MECKGQVWKRITEVSEKLRKPSVPSASTENTQLQVYVMWWSMEYYYIINWLAGHSLLCLWLLFEFVITINKARTLIKHTTFVAGKWMFAECTLNTYQLESSAQMNVQSIVAFGGQTGWVTNTWWLWESNTSYRLFGIIDMKFSEIDYVYTYIFWQIEDSFFSCINICTFKSFCWWIFARRPEIAVQVKYSLEYTYDFSKVPNLCRQKAVLTVNAQCPQ